jgi:Fungal specific transcription factor domain
VSLRVLYDRRTLWCLSGMAIRIAQQLGLHRDGSRLGLSVFETEIRRRVWWHIIYMDRTIARTSGFVPAPLPSNDTCLPLNVNDSDLHPTMKESPVERNDTSTDMIFCYMRQELGKWQDHQWKFIKDSIFSGNTIDSSSRRTNSRATDKEIEEISLRLQVVNELQETFQTKVIQHCDTSIPLHLLVSLSARSIVSTIRLIAYHPSFRYGANRKLPPLSQPEIDHLFATCLEVIHNNELLHTTECLKRYLWQFDWHFPWPALLFMFSELPHRSVLSEDTQRAWHYIDTLFLPQFSRLSAEARGPLHIVCIKLAFKAWNAHVDECRRQGVPVPPYPKILDMVSNYPSSVFSSSSRSRKGTPSQPERNSTFDSSSVFLSTQQEQSRPHQQQQQHDFSTTTNQIPPQPDYIQLPDFLGGPQDMPLDDGLLMDWADWDPIFQRMPPSFGMSNF